MNKRRKKQIAWGLLIVVLHVLAIVCERLNIESVYGTLQSIFLTLIRSSIYIALFTAWGFSVRYRIIAVHTRRYLTAAAVMMVLWMLLRTVKYGFTVDPNISRMLWYMYYIPMLLLPWISVCASLSLGKYGEFRLPVWTKLLGVATALLVLLVLTNDYHQLIFTFPENAVVFSDSDYGYAPSYYFLSAMEGICILLAYGTMLQRCRLPRSRRLMWLPIIPIAGLVLYTVLYVTNYAFLRRFAPDLTVAECCLTIAAFESCIGNGLIQVNVHYQELFENAGFPVCIMDQQNTLYMASSSGGQLAETVMQHGQQAAAMSDKGVRIHSFPIAGGNVFWEENIAGIQEEIDRLQDLQESLRESHMISSEEYRTNKEKIRLAEVNRLYDQMQLQTAGCLGSIRALLQELERETDAEQERFLLGKIAVYGAYFKRRNNLLFVEETRQRIGGDELASCLKESFAALGYLGIKASYEVDTDAEFSLHDMMAVYDLVEQVIEQSLDQLNALITVVRRSGNDCMLTLSLHIGGGIPAFPEQFDVLQEDEGEYLLNYQFAQGKRSETYESI